jgi:hypothetical protein
LSAPLHRWDSANQAGLISRIERAEGTILMERELEDGFGFAANRYRRCGRTNDEASIDPERGFKEATALCDHGTGGPTSCAVNFLLG